MAFTDELRQAADPIWSAEHEHPFVCGIGEGDLDADKFRHYVRQDYLFLIDYARVLALGCARAPRLDEMTRFAELVNERPTATTRAYTDFLLRVAALGDYGELAAALLPCMWGYHELAVSLAERGRPDNELYARWIDEYAGAEFGELTAWCRTLTDRAAETSDQSRMTDTFLTSSRYELAFWDASWRAEPPLREPRTPSPGA